MNWFNMGFEIVFGIVAAILTIGSIIVAFNIFLAIVAGLIESYGERKAEKERLKNRKKKIKSKTN